MVELIDRLRTFDQAAEAVGLTGMTLRNWVSRGHIRGYRVPGRRALHVDLAEVRAHILRSNRRGVGRRAYGDDARIVDLGGAR